MKVIHELKIEDRHYTNIMEGFKDFEVRFNDRDYQKGDYLQFKTVDGLFKRDGEWRIKHVHSGLGMQDKFVILGLEMMHP